MLGIVIVALIGLNSVQETMAGKPVSIADRVISSTIQKSRDNTPGIQLLRDDGSGALTVNRSIYGWPRWSPDGTMLGGYYKASRKGELALMAMLADGSEESAALMDTEFNAWNFARNGVVASELPAISWTGGPNYTDWVTNGAFVFVGASQYAGTSELQNRLFIVDAGGNIIPVTEAPGDPPSQPPYHDWAPDWSPVLNRIVFLSNRNGSDELYAIAPDGTDLLQISDFRGQSLFLRDPRWSPDGTRIALAAYDQTGGGDDLWILDIDLSQATAGVGGRVTSLDFFKTGYTVDNAPAWSPAGDALVFWRWTSTDGPQLVIADTVSGAETVIFDSGYVDYPDWKPVP